VDTSARLVRPGRADDRAKPREYVFWNFWPRAPRRLSPALTSGTTCTTSIPNRTANVVEVFIAHLRKKIEEPGPAAADFIPGVGTGNLLGERG